MPFAAALLASRAGEREGDIETERLYLPSSLPVPLRTRCLDDAANKEDPMRESQCYTALEEIRSVQRALYQVNCFTKANVRGTKRSGRSFDIIKRLRAKGRAAAQDYRVGRDCLVRLRGVGTWMDVLQELDDKHIRDLASEVFSTDVGQDYDDGIKTAGEKRKRANVGKGMNVQPVVFGSGSFEMSWIWAMRGALATAGEDELNGLLRVEWLKSRARVARSLENMLLIRDERERTLASLRYDATRWEERASGWAGMTPEHAEGVAAYAIRQADGLRRLAAHFHSMWMLPSPKRRVCVMDHIEVEETGEGDSDAEDDISPANALRDLFLAYVRT